MKYLYYTRHGESYINTDDPRADGHGDIQDLGLTETGRQHALAGAKAAKARGIQPDLIICSPLARTRETAAIIAVELGYPTEKIIYDDLFVEVRFGKLGGMTYKEFSQHYTYADLPRFKDAETIEMLQQRAANALKYVKSCPEDTILIVSHSCFGRAFRRVIEGRPYTDEFFPNTQSLPYGEIVQLLPASKSS